MKIVILGAGNLSTHLSYALQQAEHEIVQIYSRTEASSSTLANKLYVPYTMDIKEINQDADLYIYAINDDALPEVISNVITPDAIHVHTAGSVDMNVFKGKRTNYGVFYPLQSFSKNKAVDFKEIPIFLESSSKEIENTLISLAETISNQVFVLNSEQRLQMHIAAVYVSNFVNYIYEIASQIVKSADIPFEVLQPLIDETAQKVKTLSPYDAQTGPARRNDIGVIQKHLEALKNQPKQQDLYKQITQMILDQYLH